MKKIFLFLGLALFLFSCDDDLEFGTSSFENGSIVGMWNLNGIRYYDCNAFDVSIRNTEDTTFFFTLDSIFVDSFVIDPVLGDTLEVIENFERLDTTFNPRQGIVGFESDSIPFFDPTTGLLLGYRNRFTLVDSSNANFEVNYRFDTTFVEDRVQHFETCSSTYEFNSDGGGSYSIVLPQSSSSQSGSLRWSDKGNGVLEICFDGECRNYDATITTEGTLYLEDMSLTEGECANADYSFKERPNYIGEYIWTEVKLQNCFGNNPDSVILYQDLLCDVENDNPVTNTVGAVCYKFILDCDGTGVFDIKGGPNEGVVRINFSEISDGVFVANPTGNANADKWNFTISGNTIDLNLGEVTTLEGFTCPLEVKFQK